MKIVSQIALAGFLAGSLSAQEEGSGLSYDNLFDSKPVAEAAPAPSSTPPPSYSTSTSGYSSAPSKEEGTNVLPSMEALRSPGYYNTMQGNPAAPNTVTDIANRPALMGGQKVAFIEPGTNSNYQGLIAFPALGGGMFLHTTVSDRSATLTGPSLNSNTQNSILTTGWATSSASFGVALRFGFDKVATNNSPDGASSTDISATHAGNRFGLLGSMDVGLLELYASADYLSHGDNLTTVTATTNTVTRTRLLLVAGVRKETGYKGRSAWDISLRINGQTEEDKIGNNPSTLQDSYLNIFIPAEFGQVLHDRGPSRIFWGVGTNLAYRIWADQKGSFTSRQGITWGLLRPNFGGEYQLFENFTIVAGLSEQVELSYESLNTNAGTPPADNGKASSTYVISRATQVNTGLRYAKGSFAIEAQLNQTLWDDGVARIFSNATPGLLMNTGLFWNF